MQLAKSKVGRWIRCRTNAYATRLNPTGTAFTRQPGQLAQFGWPETRKMGGVGRHGVIVGITEGTDAKRRQYVVQPYNDSGPLAFRVEIEAKKIDAIS